MKEAFTSNSSLSATVLRNSSNDAILGLTARAATSRKCIANRAPIDYVKMLFAVGAITVGATSTIFDPQRELRLRGVQTFQITLRFGRKVSLKEARLLALQIHERARGRQRTYLEAEEKWQMLGTYI